MDLDGKSRLDRDPITDREVRAVVEFDHEVVGQVAVGAEWARFFDAPRNLQRRGWHQGRCVDINLVVNEQGAVVVEL